MDWLNTWRHSATGRAAALVAIAAALFAVGLMRIDAVSREAVVYESVCRELVRNTTEGRQALIGSAWWPPLGSLLRLPLAGVVRSRSYPVASMMVSALFGAAALMMLSRALRNWGLGRERFVAVLALALNPYFLAEAGNGSAGTTTLFLVILAAYALVQWVTGRRLRHLVYLAAAAALLAVSSFEMAAWLPAALLLLLVDLALHVSGRRQREAVIIMAVCPALYALGLWVLMNWLIMGDGLYFLRGLAGPAHRAASHGMSFTAFSRADWAAALLCVVALVTSMMARDRGGVYLGLLGVSLPAVAAVLSACGLMWDRVPILLSILPLTIMATGYAAGHAGVWTRRLRIPALGVIVALTVTAAVSFLEERRAAPSPGEFADIVAQQNTWRARLARHVLDRSRYAKVFVCGYDAFFLLGADPGPVFEYAFDLNFNKIRDDYRGHDLYVLVHRPQGRSAIDSVHWKYDRIFDLGSRTTLYDGDWGNWRLFELIQASRAP